MMMMRLVYVDQTIDEYDDDEVSIDLTIDEYNHDEVSIDLLLGNPPTQDKKLVTT